MSKTQKSALCRVSRVSVKRAHFAVRAIRNANPRRFRSHRIGNVLSRIFSD